MKFSRRENNKLLYPTMSARFIRRSKSNMYAFRRLGNWKGKYNDICSHISSFLEPYKAEHFFISLVMQFDAGI